MFSCCPHPRVHEAKLTDVAPLEQAVYCVIVCTQVGAHVCGIPTDIIGVFILFFLSVLMLQQYARYEYGFLL